MITQLPTFEEISNIAKQAYIQEFGNEPQISCCAPGRVNLIGEHIDYNDGYVLPMALPMVTIIMGSRNGSKSLANVLTLCEAVDEPKRIQFNLTKLKPELPKWANYIKGVIHSFGHSVSGFNAVIISNVPLGGGLSSSAALEVATLTFLEEITCKHIQKLTDKALICQKAEHTFAGMPCGIMDQLISVMGKKSNALLIDCKSLETVQIPFEADNLTILICNSNVRHELSASEYPTRREQCTKALELIGLKSYRESTEDHLSALQCGDTIEEVLLKRARHVITEIKRTHEAAEALKIHDYEKMGKLMTESHISLRDNFEVSCHELDVLVECAINCSGVLGSRMTGGGFGGCTVTLLNKECVDNVILTMQKAFTENCNGKSLDFYICTPSDGARTFNLL